MWILPNQRVISQPKPITIDGVQHPASIFYNWSIDELAFIGIKPYREDKYDGRFYQSISTFVEEIDGVVYRRHTLEEKYTVAQIKTRLADLVTDELKTLFYQAKNEIDFLSEFDSDSSMIPTLSQYKEDLKAARQTIKNEVQGITDYAELIQYQWRQHIPASPLDDNEVTV